MTTDQELLQSYSRDKAEESFTALVKRHLNLVYSAALRQVRSPQLAEEVAQSAFIDLARQAHRLAPDTILSAWLYQVTRRTAIDVVRREARRQLREQIASGLTAMNAPAADWTHIEPLLDEAMVALDDADRTAVLLRYFENKSLREVGQMLGVSDDAAQKRVSRAVERLREFFKKRGVAIGASGLVLVISANAIQAAPLGLFATISTAALAGTTLATAQTLTVTKALAMTTLQKSLITVTLVAAVGAGVYQARQASRLRAQVQTIQQQLSPLADQNAELTRDRDNAVRQLAASRDELALLNTNKSELLRLRSETGRLRQQTNELGKLVQSWAATNAVDQSNEPTSFPRDTWANVGFATPEATVQSFMWAKSRGDVKVAFDSATPEMKQSVMDLYFKDKSDAEISALLVESAKTQTGVKILKRMAVADDQVIFQAHFDGYPEKTYAILTLKKTGDDWKVSSTEERHEEP
ncbi:MAG: polymerase, sigma-24 subunit, subfamily [Pedosphaera sp.]|nr:polymerase, sigma-24 subunit, subfamily [Pedosphaera sp.]